MNPSVVYPFLDRHRDKLNQDLIALIPAFATSSNIADLFNFANFVQEFPLGQRGVNLEIAIAIYRKALDFVDRENHSSTWAAIQNNLAIAYSERIQGERSENLERAISAWESALEVYSRRPYSDKWATAQINQIDNLVTLFEISKNFQYIDKAFTIYKTIITNNQDIIASAPLVFYRLGKTLSKQGVYQKAIQTLETVLAILQEHSWNHVEQLHLMALTLFELARLSHKLLRLDHSKLYFKDALRLFYRLDDENSAASVMTALGNLELQVGQNEAAQFHLESALVYYENQNKLEEKEEVERLLKLLDDSQKKITIG